MKISIRVVLFFSFLAVIWGTFLLTTTSSQITSERVMTDHARVIMENISSYVMEQSQNYLSKAQRATQLTKRLLRSQVLGQENEGALENYFLEQLVTYPDISGIYLGTPEGDFFFVSRSSNHSPGGTRTKVISHKDGVRQVHYTWRDSRQVLVGEEDDPADNYDPRIRPWYQGAVGTDGIFWTDPYIFYTSQKPGITISGPTYLANGKLRGVVGVDIEIDQLSTFISQLRIGTHGRAFMLDRNRDVVAFHDVDKIKFHSAGETSSSRLVKIDEFNDKLCRAAFRALGVSQKPTNQILLNRAKQAEFELDGENYQAMFTPFPDSQWPWIIGMYLPENDYLGELKQNRINNYLITFGISVLASFLILFIARSIARPVLGLQRYAEDISAGNFTRDMTRQSPQSLFKEVSETASRFDGLMSELGQSRQQYLQAEQSLKLKEDQYASLVENLHVGVFRIDNKGGILSSNQAFAHMAGCATVAELKQHNVAELYFDPAERDKLIETLKAHRNVNNWELKLQPIGCREPIWASLCCSVEGDNPDSYVDGLVEDITERKHSEEMLILSERMAAVGTMVSGVAHEFNNIHTGVLGFAELGMQLEDIPNRAKNYFETIRNSSLRSRDLTENLLSCSSQQGAKMARAALNPTILENYSLVEREYASDGIALKYDFTENPEFLMDRTQVGQVILNLLINARHSLIGRPEKQIHLSSGVRGNQVWVKVADSGCGIPEDHLKKIFTPFFSTKGEYARSDSPQATVRGTGLGLSVCHTIAKNHGGRIAVDSQPEVGSTFTLWLPLRDAEIDATGPNIEHPKLFVSPNVGGRILVVDDELNIRDLISQALTGQGYEVVTTDDGEEGLRIVRDEGVDLVLVDIQMPKMSGLDFLCKLQSFADEQRPRAMVITGKILDFPTRIHGDLDVYGTLVKPFAINELQTMVHDAMTQKHSASQA